MKNLFTKTIIIGEIATLTGLCLFIIEGNDKIQKNYQEINKTSKRIDYLDKERVMLCDKMIENQKIYDNSLKEIMHEEKYRN